MAKSAKSPSNGTASVPPNTPNPDRERMIAEAAYYRALERGFQGGDPLDDWLTAEREMDKKQ